MNLVYTSQFKKDFKRVQRQAKDISKLEALIDILLNGEKLAVKYKDHPLTGQ